MNTKSKIQIIREQQAIVSSSAQKVESLFEMYNVDDIFIDKNGNEVTKGYFVEDKEQNFTFERMNDVISHLHAEDKIMRITEACQEEGKCEEYDILVGKLITMHEIVTHQDRITHIETFEDI